MNIKKHVKFDLESNPSHRFQAIYEGLRLVVDREKQRYANQKGTFSLVGAEAYSMLEDLKITHPKQCEQAAVEFKNYHPTSL